MNQRKPMICVSIVSHGQGEMVEALLEDLNDLTEVSLLVLTHNIQSEPDITLPSGLRNRTIKLRNRHPKGFGENHNHAFSFCEAEYFLVVNPDVRLDRGNPLPVLIAGIERSIAAVAVPVVVGPTKKVEDSIRFFPTPIRLLLKLLGLDDGRISILGGELREIDWAAGMFMLFRADAYRKLDGFDEKFFLYYEDADICARCRKLGLTVVACPGAEVTHDAQRASHKRPSYFWWHLRSLIRYQLKHFWLR